MKKYILLIILIAVAAFYNLHGKPKHVIRVGVHCDHAPYNWEENKPSKTNFALENNPGFYAEGYDVQIAALVASEMGAEVKFYKVPFDDLINALNAGKIDAIFSGMVDSDKRKKVINFSVPYEVRKTEYAVLINRESRYTDATSLKDLDGIRIIAVKNSRFDDVIDQIPNVHHLSPLERQTQIIDEVINHRADGTVLNYDTAESYERTYSRNLLAIRFSDGDGFELGFTGLCAGVRKSDGKLLDEINSAIEGISMRQRQKVMDNVIKVLWEHVQ